MTFTINLNAIVFILCILGCIAVVYLIKVLHDLTGVIKNAKEITDKVNTVLDDNTDNIKVSVSELPQVIKNFGEVGENLRDTSEVVTDIAADVIVTKENLKTNIDVVTDILHIIKNVFT